MLKRVQHDKREKSITTYHLINLFTKKEERKNYEEFEEYAIVRGGGESLYGIREAKGVKREGFNKENNPARSALKGPIALMPYCPIALRSAFTMAEILLSLTIIGVVAAITLPSLTGNINERTWNTQRKALYARMSQAIALMPALNGYGRSDDAATVLDKAAEVFVTSGLSKVLKINNICDNAHLSDCGFPTKINPTAAAAMDPPTKLSELNYGLTATGTGKALKDTKAAAFETANGESVLAFYNPECTASNVLDIGNSGGTSGGGTTGYFLKQHVCANFVFDLNGKKGPNTVGKDIGFITVVYSSDSNVVMPLYPKAVAGSFNHLQALQACGNIDGDEYRLPNLDELLSIYYNRYLLGESIWGAAQKYWSTTVIDSTQAWTVGNSYGMKYPLSKDEEAAVVCVKRM